MKSINNFFYLLASCVFILTSCVNQQNAENFEKPKNAISYEKAKALQKEYLNTRVKSIQEAYKALGIEKKPDVRDVTYSLEGLKQYLAYVEKEAEKKGLKGLGIRVYLGAYKGGDVTMFFMPTHQKTPKASNVNNFFYVAEDEVIEGVDGYNFGIGGQPPRDMK
ncbi:hypothetical protein [Tenacibaculum sp. UWU-22]|uniref:hypothetical protein n=1 Tax=Tenacibaculum sp. UWU-22 TaxID=3234187 RepID=UPI0034DAFC8D